MDAQNTDDRNTSGYVMDLPYTWSFFGYQSPVLMSYAARLKGHSAPSPDKPFTYCDLGCGNGVTVNLLAAAFPQSTFYGIDFNPEHVANARALAQKAGLTNVSFIDASFEEMLRYELPGFDYVGLHGVYSWVNAEIRGQVRAVIDRFLNPGGLFYLCYYTHPGASELVPLWKLMQSYMSNLDEDLVSNAKTALAGMIEARDAGSRFFRENPYANRYLDKLKRRDTRFFVHEFCNGAFEPQFFSDVANDFSELGLDFAASARLDRNRPDNVISSRLFGHVDQAGDAIERETRISFLRNESFRWDIFVRDGGVEEKDPLSSMLVGAKAAVSNQTGKQSVGRREIDLDASPYRNVVAAAAPGLLTLGEVAEHPDLKQWPAEEVIEVLHELIAADILQPLLTKASALRPEQGTVFKFCDEVNRAFIEDSLFTEGKVYVASPVTGSAMRLSFTNGLFAMFSDGNQLPKVPGLVHDRLIDLTKSDRKRLLGSSDKITDAWVKRAGQRFASNYLPRLAQQKILVPT
ncbi:MAG: methyltransferase domain-containing protein [Paracoccaceae bacterium]